VFSARRKYDNSTKFQLAQNGGWRFDCFNQITINKLFFYFFWNYKFILYVFFNNYFFKIKMNTRPAANAKEPKKKLEKNIISF
jgi:hypothetical protein